MVTYPNFINNAIAYHPFHMVYGELKGNFYPLEDKKIELIVKKNSNNILMKEIVKLIRDGVFTIFCSDDVNRAINKNYKIKSNSFIYVHPYHMNDGYQHNTISTVSSINTNSKDYTNHSYGYGMIEILYGIITSFVLFVMQLTVIKLYFITYYKKFILELKIN